MSFQISNGHPSVQNASRVLWLQLERCCLCLDPRKTSRYGSQFNPPAIQHNGSPVHFLYKGQRFFSKTLFQYQFYQKGINFSILNFNLAIYIRQLHVHRSTIYSQARDWLLPHSNLHTKPAYRCPEVSQKKSWSLKLTCPQVLVSIETSIFSVFSQNPTS